MPARDQGKRINRQREGQVRGASSQMRDVLCRGMVTKIMVDLAPASAVPGANPAADSSTALSQPGCGTIDEPRAAPARL
jgi:hypothetical protein